MTSLPEQCCTLPPFKTDYEPVGKRFMIKVEGQDELEVYSTGSSEAKTALVAIFGMCRVSPQFS